MAIASLRIKDFRNLAEVELAPCLKGLNLICGKNGSGKTSLLEAIYYLSLGRSFRSASVTRLIRQTCPKFSLFAQLISESKHIIPAGVERDAKGTSRVRMNETEITSVAELAQFLPLQIINSHSHQLFESGPIFRRRYLDWGLFYQEKGFLRCWRHYGRVLKQRNVLLKNRRPKNEIDVWTEELIKYGLDLNKMRRNYVECLLPNIIGLANILLGISSFTMEYLPGWNQEDDFSSALVKQFPEEFRLGHTQIGPHRADFEIKIDGISVKHFLSRGQQKLLICAMILAQGMLLMKNENKGLIYLVDDLPSELDLSSRNKLISLLAQENSQVFITAIDSDMIYDSVGHQLETKKVFHVEHGSVREQPNKDVGG